MANQETAVQKAAAPKGVRADHDRVVMATRNPDGSIRDFDPEFIGPKDDVIAAAKEQLAQIAVSNVDQAERGVSSEDQDDEDAARDAENEALKKKHDAAADAARKAAEAEVNALHDGLGDK